MISNTYLERRLAGALLAASVILAVGCTTTVEDDVFSQVGATRLFVLSPRLTSQRIFDPDKSVQVAAWSVETANLTIENEGSFNLVTEGSCEVIDTVFVLQPVYEGGCENGVIMPEIADPRAISLEFSATLQVRRAAPPDLPALGDFDQDGIDNKGDSCPLLHNPDQKEICFFPVQESDGSIGNLRDSDFDGIPDGFDNCAWVANSGQEDTDGVRPGQIPDFIGDACAEQIAEVSFNMSPKLETTLQADGYVQQSGAVTLITVDLRDAELICDWVAGTCDIADLSAIRLCVADPGSPGSGCLIDES